MKNILAAAAAAVVFAGCLTGCGSKKEETPGKKYVGLWECNKMEVNGRVYEESFMDSGIPLHAVYRLDVKEGGVGVLVSPMSAIAGDSSGDSDSFYWSVEDGKLKLQGATEEDVILLTYDNGTLIMDEGEGVDEIKAYFGKVEEFSEFDFGKWAEENYSEGSSYSFEETTTQAASSAE